MRSPGRAPHLSTSTASPIPKMPLDKQKHGTPAKPFTPTLSSNFRTTKSPLTPRLAGSAQSTPANSPRRGLQTGHNASPRAPPLTTNTPNLNGNVTPRSGARKSRAFDSPSTPNELDVTGPVNSRPHAATTPQIHGSTAGQDTYGLGISDQNSRVLSTTQHFFRADDANSSVASYEGDARPPPPQKKNTFFYASGQAESSDASGTIKSTTSLPGRTIRPTVNAQTVPPVRSPPSTTSSPVLPSLDVPRKGPVRPPSPLKGSSFQSAPGDLQHQIGPILDPRSPPLFPKRSIDGERPQRYRKPSLGDSTPSVTVSHRKSLSNSSQKSMVTDATKSRKNSLTSPSQPSIAHQMTASPLPSPTTSFSIEQKRHSLGHSSEGDAPSVNVSKPEAAGPSQIQIANELAANARRERKVLDLEISNSSLLAINRTLEREMRKQSAELRRFRRLSRAGRLSIAASSIRSVSGESGLSTLPEGEDTTLSDLEENSEMDEEDDLDSSLDDSEIANLTPEAQAELDLRHRTRDERRLQLDLSKHQQMLIDSQKMNQSIRRCMAWTDELLVEGKKALEYQVHVSDVQLGGRVLALEDDAPEVRQGLLSPSTTMQAFEEMQMWADKLQELGSTDIGNIDEALRTSADVPLAAGERPALESD